MRPKKRIVLLAADEQKRSVLKFMLETNGFAVFNAPGVEETMQAIIGSHSRIDLLLMRLPIADLKPLSALEKILARKNDCDAEMHWLVIGKMPEALADKISAEENLWNPSGAELLERVKLFTARKRGPKKTVKSDYQMVAAKAMPA